MPQPCLDEWDAASVALDDVQGIEDALTAAIDSENGTAAIIVSLNADLAEALVVLNELVAELGACLTGRGGSAGKAKRLRAKLAVVVKRATRRKRK